MTKPPDPLLRAVAGVLLGYVALASLTFLSQAAIGQVLSLDELLEPGRFTPKPLFIVLQIVTAIIAGLVAGYLCRLVAIHRRPGYVLAAIVSVFMFYQAIFAFTIPIAPVARTGDETAEAIQAGLIADQPAWLILGLAVAIVSAILLGSRRRAFKLAT